MATVLVLGASVSQVDVIRRARDRGLRVVAVDGDPEAIGLAEADVALTVDFSDIESVIDVCRRHSVDGVLAVSTDRAVPVAAEVTTRLGLPGIDPATAQLMTNKRAMRERLTTAGLRQPRWISLGSEEAAAGAAPEVGYPAVLKPVDSGGQRGVYRIENASELRARLPQTLAHSQSGRALLEQYLPGPELNGIVVVVDSVPHLITLSDRLRPPGPGFGVGWIHLFPSTLDAATTADAAKVALDAVTALGLRDGIAFPQLIVGDEGATVVEVAARIPAGQMNDLVYYGVGIDLIEIAIRQALGRPVGSDLWQPRFQQALAIRFFTASPGVLPTGRVVGIAGLDGVRQSPGVLKADLYMRIGETINPVQVDADRRGYVIATATAPDAALMRADKATLNLRIQVEPV